MERTISATPRHSEDELKQLFTKTLKLSSLWYAYEMLKDDSDFCDLPFSEQFYELGKVCHQKRLDNKYRLLKKDSNIPASEILQPASELAKSNGVTISKIELVVNKLIQPEQGIVIVNGPAGTGKSTFGMSILDHVMKMGYKTSYYDYTSEMMMLTSMYDRRDAYNERLSRIYSNKIIVLDDFLLNNTSTASLQTQSSDTANTCSREITCLKELLDSCRANGCSIIILSQLTIDTWYKRIIADCKNSQFASLAVDAVMDRLLADPLIINLKGQSRRRKGKLQKVDMEVSDLKDLKK